MYVRFLEFWLVAKIKTAIIIEFLLRYRFTKNKSFRFNIGLQKCNVSQAEFFLEILEIIFINKIRTAPRNRI